MTKLLRKLLFALSIQKHKNSSNRVLEEKKFGPIYNSKNMTFKVVGILVLAIIFILPASVLKSISIEDENNINLSYGRFWQYASQLTIPFFYQNVFPAYIILGNPKMYNSLKREFKESPFGRMFDKFQISN